MVVGIGLCGVFSVINMVISLQSHVCTDMVVGIFETDWMDKMYTDDDQPCMVTLQTSSKLIQVCCNTISCIDNNIKNIYISIIFYYF